ncbi:hypothetical protein [Altericista sp. CCNU0014]|uniref:hypothetical protein n=1 Tax=Altericista sp. CCNU0014 TaxID=3082949 RepID=UPI00384D3ED8
MHHLLKKLPRWINLRPFLIHCSIASTAMGLTAAAAVAQPYGTWLSKPQIMFHLSNSTLGPVMDRMRAQRYRVVFLDFRNVSSEDQQRVAQTVRQYQLVPIAWIQSPQFRTLSVQQIIDEGRHADGIQVDDHFFANYSRADFFQLRSQYRKQIYCSIQPFQAALMPPTGCNQRDVQCYAPINFKQCMGLADRLRAVTSLSSQNTLGYRDRMGGRSFNVFLWPHSHEFATHPPAQTLESTTWNRGF